jgi:hypothetical protein
MAPLKVLIIGGGVAGPALAHCKYWIRKLFLFVNISLIF